MDQILVELKKDNIIEITLEADLPLKQAPSPPGSMAWGRERLLDSYINLFEPKCPSL